MSLIDDALKRAQSAQQGETGPGEGAPVWTPPPLPDRSRIRRARAVRIAAASLAAAAVAGGLLLVLRSRRPSSAAPRSPASVAVKASSAAAGLPPITSEVVVAPPPRGVAPAAPAGPRAQAVPAAPQVRQPAAARVPTAVAVREGPAASPPIPTGRERERGIHAPAETRSFAGEMALPGGGKISLDGIVYSEAHPVAVLNGRITSPGGYVEGYTVSKIQQDKVELERDGTTVTLTLRQ